VCIFIFTQAFEEQHLKSEHNVRVFICSVIYYLALLQRITGFFFFYLYLTREIVTLR